MFHVESTLFSVEHGFCSVKAWRKSRVFFALQRGLDFKKRVKKTWKKLPLFFIRRVTVLVRHQLSNIFCISFHTLTIPKKFPRWFWYTKSAILSPHPTFLKVNKSNDASLRSRRSRRTRRICRIDAHRWTDAVWRNMQQLNFNPEEHVSV